MKFNLSVTWLDISQPQLCGAWPYSAPACLHFNQILTILSDFQILVWKQIWCKLKSFSSMHIRVSLEELEMLTHKLLRNQHLRILMKIKINNFSTHFCIFRVLCLVGVFWWTNSVYSKTLKALIWVAFIVSTIRE